MASRRAARRGSGLVERVTRGAVQGRRGVRCVGAACAASRRARLGAASLCACAAQWGCLARRGARPRKEARARGQGAGSGRGERGEPRPGVRGRATLGGMWERGKGEEGEREGKENRKRKRKMWKKRNGKERERDMLGGDRGVDRGCTRTRVGRAWRGGRRYAMRGIGKREELDSD